MCEIEKRKYLLSLTLCILILIGKVSSTSNPNCNGTTGTQPDCAPKNLNLDLDNTNSTVLHYPVGKGDFKKAVVFHTPEHPIIPLGFFDKFPNASEVTLEKLGIESINKSDFVKATHLEVLRLSHNKIEKLPSEVFILATHLETIELSDNLLKDIASDAFKGLEKLKNLFLNKNQIKALPNNLFSGLKQLSELNLAYNEFERFGRDIIQENLELKKFSIRNNRLIIFESNSLKHLEKLEVVDLSFNKIDEIHLKSINTLRLNNAKMNNIYINGSIARLYANNNQLKNLTIVDLSQLVELELSNATFSNAKYFKMATKLEKLDLSYNPIGSIDRDSFTYMTELLVLNLRGNNFTGLHLWSFVHQEKLTHLDISYNYLGKIDLNDLRPLKNLKSLNIDGNNLTTFDYKRVNYYFEHLNEISLSDNEWSCTNLAEINDYLKSRFIDVHPNSKAKCQTDEGDKTTIATTSVTPSDKKTTTTTSATPSDKKNSSKLPNTNEEFKLTVLDSLNEMNKSWAEFTQNQEKINAEQSVTNGRIYTITIILLVAAIIFAIYKILVCVSTNYGTGGTCLSRTWPRYNMSRLNDPDGL